VAVRWRNAEGTKVGLSQGMKSFADLLRIRADHRETSGAPALRARGRQ
jgi:hypothetical protein